MKRIAFVVICFIVGMSAHAEDGYRLWLRYDKIGNAALLQEYRSSIQSINFPETSPTLAVACKELQMGLQGLLDKKIAFTNTPGAASLVVTVGQKNNSPNGIDYAGLGKEGFAIRTVATKGKKQVLIAANADAGALYGVFHFLRLIQTGQTIQNLNITSVPKIEHR